LKVVIPIYGLMKGGGQKVLALTANALVEAGHEVTVVMPQLAKESIHYAVQAPITFVPEWESSAIPYGDIILTNFYLTVPWAYHTWPEQCVRLVLGFEPDYLDDQQGHVALWTYQQGIPCICNSAWIRQKIFEQNGQQSPIIHHGINPAIFSPKGQGSRGESPTPPFVISYLARPLFPSKGYVDFIRGVREVIRRYALSIRIHVVWTEGCFFPPIDLPYHSFSPETDQEMAEFYRSSDLYVSTSHSEGFSLPPLEAMGCGIPVLTTDSGGIREFCKDRQNALIVPAKDIPALAEGIAQLLTNSDLRSTLICGGIKTAQTLTEERFKTKIVRELETIHAKKTGR
jgi:glycosyltransferase involved in cell wall biosynthesis